jgi:hypothetical protein
MNNIYLATDKNCWTERKIQERKTGGTENFFLILRRWLIEEGYSVYDPVLNPLNFHNNTPDLTIFSNSYEEYYKGKKNILWSGSWHVSSSAPVDLHICVSKYFQKKAGIKSAIVIPPPYDNDIDKYKDSQHTPRRIVSTSNPNRYMKHAIEVCKFLDDMEVNYEYHFSGGNKLYSDEYPEAISFCQHPKLFHRGILNRHELLNLLTSAHVWVYPNFSNDSETFCSSVVEAAALGKQIIVPRREPFLSTIPEAFFAEDSFIMSRLIKSVFEKNLSKKVCDVSHYKEEAVKAEFMRAIKEMLS